MAILSADPLDIKLDVNGDLDFTGGGPSLVSGLDGVAQLCRMTILMFRGEWFLERTVGVPYYDNDFVTESQAILGQKFSANKITRIYTTELLKVPGVGAVLDLIPVFDNKGRILSVSFTVKTVFGDTINDDVLIGAQ